MKCAEDNCPSQAVQGALCAWHYRRRNSLNTINIRLGGVLNGIDPDSADLTPSFIVKKFTESWKKRLDAVLIDYKGRYKPDLAEFIHQLKELGYLLERYED